LSKVQAAGSRCGEAHTDLARELRVAAHHEGGGFFMAHLDEANLFLPRPQRLDDPVDAIAGQAEHHVDAPFHQRVDEAVRCRFAHDGGASNP
jgi:hypothetical protein